VVGDEIKSTSENRRQITLIAGGAILLVILFSTFYFLFVRTSYAVLFSDLETADAATIVAELDNKKTPYRLRDGGRTILIAEDQVDSVRLNVAGSDLPLKGSVGFELFNKSDMGLTEFAQRINYQRALQGELARTISTLDGVASARVHLTLAERGIFRESGIAAKASVAISMRNGAVPEPAQIEGIQRLVAAAVPNLVSENVIVIDVRGKLLSSVVATPIGALALQKQAIEQYYVDRVRTAIRSTASDAGISIAIWATLGDTLASTEGNPLEKAFSAQERPFSLQVTLSRSEGNNSYSDDVLLDAVRRAINFDATKGDAVAFGAAPPVLRTSPQPYVANKSESAETVNLATRYTSPDWRILVGGIALLMLCVIAYRRWQHWRSNTLLSNEERQAYVMRIRALIASQADDIQNAA
jgi:flagellar M-ring protein FliF